MQVTTIVINGVGGIEHITLNFNDKMNILCGPNGVGKTTILESLSHLFTNIETNVLKRNINNEQAQIYAAIDVGGVVIEQRISFDNILPNLKTHLTVSNYELEMKNLISIKTTRTFDYQELQSISRDTIKDSYTLRSEAIHGIRYHDIKNWFANRFLYSVHQGVLTEEQIQNFELAKRCFSILNPKFTFSRVNASNNEILINTPSGEIYYEYLSSGFKSVFSILFGIIKELEYRFQESKIIAKDFTGIILIDELELHLHPEWQERIINILTEVFPKVQFFVSTHSAHIIQNAEPKQIIALNFSNENKVYQRELPSSKYGFKGWTIEEVLRDVMGMQSLRTDLFTSIIESFGKAIDSENIEQAEIIYQQIDDLLHPQNELRKLLKFQLIGIK